MVRKSANFKLGAVQKYANLVELEKCCKMSIWLQNLAFIDSISVLIENEYLVAKFGFDTEENGPNLSKVMRTGHSRSPLSLSTSTP